MTTKQDDIGYCVYVQVDKVSVLRMSVSQFSNPAFQSIWIKKLLGGKLDNLEIKESVSLEGVYRQFSNLTIDIFVDADSIDKGLPVICMTSKEIPLYGNVVILASDKEGETLLLNENQAKVAVAELGFYKQKENIEVIDAITDGNKYLTTEQHPQVLKNLLALLVDYCVDSDVQLITKAIDSRDEQGDTAMVVCLHGDSVFIDECHQLLSDFINSKFEKC